MEDQGRGLVRAVGCEKYQLETQQSNHSSVLECMYALDYTTLQAMTPEWWSYSGDFDPDTKTPSPRPYPGLLIVDGVTIPLPLEAAYAAPIVDVPVLFGSMQSEFDNDHPDWTSQADFDAYCTSQFANPPWPKDMPNELSVRGL